MRQLWPLDHNVAFIVMLAGSGVPGDLLRRANAAHCQNCNPNWNSATGPPSGNYGLFFIKDDIAKIGSFLNVGDSDIGGEQILDKSRLQDALFCSDNAAEVGFRGNVAAADRRHVLRLQRRLRISLDDCFAGGQ